MKKIIILLTAFILCYAVGFSQTTYPVNQYIGAPSTLVTSKGGFKSDSALILPTFADTSKANISTYIKKYPGTLIRVKDTIFFRSADTTKWLPFTSSTGASITAWELTGNSNAIAGTNFLGTTNNIPLEFRIKNVKSGIIDSTNKNVGLGFNTLKLNNPNGGSIGTYNVAIGHNALSKDTFGVQSVAVGGGAMGTFTTKSVGNVAVGYAAMNQTRTPTYDVALGWGSLSRDYYGSANVAIGADVANFLPPGVGDTMRYNTMVGYASGYQKYSGRNNVFIGDSTGALNQTGSRNVFIGSRAGKNETGSDKLYIANSSTTSPLIKGDFANQTVIIDGKLLVGGSQIPDSTLDVKGGVRFQALLPSNNSSDSMLVVKSNGGVGYRSVPANPPASGYYGAWQDNVTQTAAVSNTGYAMIFRTIDLSNGVSVVSNGTNLTRITFANTGVYNLQFSSQFQNTDNAQHDITVWLRLNGTDVAGSAGFISIPARKSAGAGNEGHLITGWNYVLNVVAGQYYELMWSTSNAANVTMQYYAAGSPPPSAASVIMTVTQQAGILAGTGITAINSLTGAAQTMVTGTDSTDFRIVSTGTTHKFNLPTASATNRGALSSANWSTFNSKLGASDTVSLSNRINLKLNIVDTSTMLSPYIRLAGTGLTKSSQTLLNNLSTGVAGGQSVVGGTAASNSLTLSSTTNATKGKLLFGTSAYDEVNNRLGIGTASPATDFHLSYSNNAYGQGVIIQNTNTGTTAITGLLLRNSSAVDVAQFSYYPSNYIVAAQANSVSFGSVGQQKLSFGANTSANGAAAQDIVFSTLGTNSTYQMQIKGNGNVQINTNTDAGYKLDVNGTARANQFQLSALNTAPATATSTGTTGEIRIVNGAIYVCVATNTWQRALLTTF